ncbi:MAG: ATP-binding cassette, subfamily B, bacterial MsbA [Halanaerobium sp. 4-GBenrich]|jgi:subfamily B ATP-binding cassette protein MsbA|uniref:ABC-type multidrug transport system fused ATPase/permease subunit n=1 Tax=Halanaerobium congolense TaxID=54121 RepID=A0A1M7JSP9_9FIRM|nr:ABC transporter ATP-binding protein [Halanaerobium congolense]KXS49208.1 MAG: ATP-binding cassette, subfamily B, bacterial MsbA [Halanaerobium sp. T82-1]ODS50393.1 MAG: ATP-binding cassette, subfamily B, bacterial MsbA [Halanaerobium sp. 4-GBenrich]PUU92802.1 MAG: ATP-binding cassette, subfamily B, bacterial MsbA [Halanaerobium sp.]TDX46738.1 ABC-type multidrug transport system fused ATPase/permease subunit [Halanaerobium congolense]SDI32780.1 ATP-binding cassette, subfamily B, MsbA [Halana
MDSAKGNNEIEILKRVFKYLLPYKGRMAGGVISMLVHAFLTIFFVRVFQGLLETIISDIDMGREGMIQLSLVAGMMILVYFLKGVAYYGKTYLVSYVSQRSIKDMRDDLYSHLHNLSLSFYSKNKTGDILSRVTNDVQNLESSMINTTVGSIDKVFTLIGGIVYLVYLNYRLTIFLIIILPFITYVIVKFNYKLKKVSRRVQIKIADVSDVLQETLSAVRVVKSFGREEYEFERFSTENQANFRAKMKKTQYGAILTPLVEFLAAISFTAILWYGGYEVMQGRMSASELIAFFTLLLTISEPLRSITKLSKRLQQLFASAERVFEIMDTESELREDDENKIELTDVEGEVVYDNVTFAYNRNEVVLKNINLKAEPGEVVALVGHSGAGKTTMVDLIPRFFDPIEGRMRVDGHDLKDVKIDSLRDFIGIVPQETILFSGSLRDNIAYGDLEADQEAIQAAAEAANAHDFIMAFPDGYDTMVGERGVGLSGGQKQRISIARAILKNPKILILDEATSSLDSESEALVQEALEHLMQNRTTFIIAHRLSTIRNADKIVVVEQGEIMEMGSHQELLKKQGKYASLYKGQFIEDPNA